ncbi:MAG: ABC transporter substrate-binding protein [Mycobacteriaceae bacterium]
MSRQSRSRNTSTTRRATAASTVALSLAVTGCSVSDDGADGDGGNTPITLQTSWVPLVQFGGSYIADNEGYYNDNGVDVDILPGGPDVDAMSAVVSGQADIGMSNADTVARANAEGADLVIVAAGFQKNPLSLLSTPEDPINEPSDMEGKRIGVPSGDDAAHNALIEHNNVDEAQVESVPVSFDIAPLTSGEVDGLWVFYAEQPVSYLESAGEEGNVMMTSDFGFDNYAQVYAVDRASLEDDDKRESITGFLKGEIQGWEDYVDDPAEAVDLTVNDYAADSGLTEENQTEQAERQMELLVTPETDERGLLQISEEGIRNNVATLTELGIDGVDESLFDTSILEEIYPEDAETDDAA